MEIFIPIWVLWLIGIPIVIVIIGFAVFGLMFLWAFKDGIF